MKTVESIKKFRIFEEGDIVYRSTPEQGLGKVTLVAPVRSADDNDEWLMDVMWASGTAIKNVDAATSQYAHSLQDLVDQTEAAYNHYGDMLKQAKETL